jgi:hypothetical protein
VDYKILISSLLLATALSACGGGGGGGDSVASVPPAPPVAAIAALVDVDLGTPVKLDGRASTVAANRSAAYQWELSKRPGGSQAILTEATTATPGFAPDVSGVYEVRLLVSDGTAQSVAVTASLNVRVPRQPNLWQAATGAVPPVGNYVYIEGASGDYISGGRSYLYTDKDTVLKFAGGTNMVTVNVQGDQDWDGEFALPEAKTRIEPGVYTELKRYPFHVKADGGLNWSGEGRGCNTLTGWFTIDYVHYTGGKLDMLDMRFEQHCEQGPYAMHGQVHWVAGDTTVAPGPAPIPADLWQPLPGSTPASGTYVYLNSSLGDYIGAGKTYTYTPASAPELRIDVSGNSLRVIVGGWNGTFVDMANLTQMSEGYYAGLLRYPFHNPVKGGLDWSGNGRGCNQLSGWLAIDKITFQTGNLTYLDARFEQHCEMGSSALRGKIHYER